MFVIKNKRPFRFGVLGEHIRTRNELIETARKAEGSGYATFLLRDHFVEEPFGHQLAPLTALATVAAITSTLRVGTLVFANDYRHPVMLAKEAATLDVLSGGRFELGLGAGFLRPEYGAAGMPFDPPGVRVQRFEESLQILKGMFATEPLTFRGKHYTVTDLDSFPKPVQQPRPLILVGAGGRRMLSIAARHADIIGLLTVNTTSGQMVDDPRERLAEAVSRKIGWIREAACERLPSLELSSTATIVLDEDRHRAAEKLARDRNWHGISPEQVLEMPALFIGSLEQIAEQMQERRERYGFSYYVVSDASAELATPLVARLAGT
jgi:probable F420-dependent oxidoreductase